MPYHEKKNRERKEEMIRNGGYYHKIHVIMCPCDSLIHLDIEKRVLPWGAK